MSVGNDGRRFGEPRGDFFPLAFKFGHARLHRGLVKPVLDRRHDTRDSAVDLRDRADIGVGLDTALAVLAVDMGGIGGHRRLDLIGRHQPVGDARERAAFEFLALDRAAVVAIAFAVMAGAAVAIVDDNRIGAATLAAFEQPREQVGRTPLAMQRARLCGFLDRHIAPGNVVLLALHRRPQIVADDTQFGNRLPDPFGLRIEARNAFPRSGVFDIMFVVPDADAHIKLVVDNTRAAPCIAANSCVAPCRPFRAGDAIGVEIARDGARALARSELAEDALDDERLRGIDLALAAHQLAFAVKPPDDTIAVGIRPG